MIYRQLLDRIASFRQEVGATNLRPGAAIADILRTRFDVERFADARLPEAYADFLHECNGLNENGYWLYSASPAPDGSDDWANQWNVQKMTSTWRVQPGREKQLVLGHGDGELYVVNLKGKKPRAVAEDSDDEYEEFETVEQMILHVLRQALGNAAELS